MAVITISREAGGGGESIAELVATKLGFKFFNKDLVKYIAILSDKTEEEVKKFDEAINANLRSSISGFFEKKGVFSNPFGDLLNFDNTKKLFHILIHTPRLSLLLIVSVL
jgi:cytidylate kinase